MTGTNVYPRYHPVLSGNHSQLSWFNLTISNQLWHLCGFLSTTASCDKWASKHLWMVLFYHNFKTKTNEIVMEILLIFEFESRSSVLLFLTIFNGYYYLSWQVLTLLGFPNISYGKLLPSFYTLRRTFYKNLLLLCKILQTFYNNWYLLSDS